MRAIFAALLVGAFAPVVFSQGQVQIQDWSQLIGKRVVVQRMPLCQAGTYKLALSYAGKEAKVISITPSPMAHALKGAALDRLTPEARSNVIDQQKAATILLEFADGARIDSCGPITPGRASEYVKLSEGESLLPAPATGPGNEGGNTSSAGAVHAAAGDMLSDAEITAAMNGIGKDHWALIYDQSFRAGQGALGGWPFVALYLPEAVIAAKNEQAKKQFLSYQPSEEDRKRSLTVVAHGYVGETYQEGCESITRVVMVSSESGGVVEEAYLSGAATEAWSNAYGATNNCQLLKAKFSLAAVERVRSAAKDGEFFIAVFAGSQKSKTYKIKRKHQTKLGLSSK